ncbi:MAG: glycosyltransferase family 4 protein [Alphaproteobacteria bacterium]|nr:glycosyltransferase family 4 protein [Alphaproteobacteria bacterium]
MSSAAALPYSDQPAQKRRVAIITAEILGPVRNGGIATAYTGLAEALAAEGHAVDILFVDLTNAAADGSDGWVNHYATQGISLSCLPGSGDLVALSQAAAEWLRGRNADIAHFHDWLGLGAAAIAEKRAGKAFFDTLLVVGTHGPSAWAAEGNAVALDPGIDHQERRSVALADVLVSPSAYLLDWFRARGWDLPRQYHVQQNLLPGRADLPPPRQTLAVRELVFFGRLERRKGVVLFCDALDLLATRGKLAGLSVTLLGRTAPVDGQDGLTYARHRAQHWGLPVTAIGDRDTAAALAYLKEGNRLAVIPSLIENSPCTVLECLLDGIPFLAADVGGVAELIAPDDRASLLFAAQAEALAGRLEQVLTSGAMTGAPAIPQAIVRQGWTNWHATVPHKARWPRALWRFLARIGFTPA